MAGLFFFLLVLAGKLLLFERLLGVARVGKPGFESLYLRVLGVDGFLEPVIVRLQRCIVRLQRCIVQTRRIQLTLHVFLLLPRLPAFSDGVKGLSVEGCADTFEFFQKFLSGHIMGEGCSGTPVIWILWAVEK